MAKMMRDLYGEILCELGAADERVVVLDADLSLSNRTAAFAARCPDRFYNVGIAEANMAAMAAGMAAAGAIPFLHTFATFATSLCLVSAKCLIGYDRLNVRIIGANNGLSGNYDGSTHHALDDLAVMRAIPGMLVCTPSDGAVLRWLVGELIHSHSGPAYLSLARSGCGPLYPPDTRFELGRASALREGFDAAVIACGSATGRAAEAADLLAAEGLGVRVIDLHTLKPLDEEAVLRAARETGAVVTAEEHSVIGGVGSAVAELLCRERISPAFETVGVRDTYTQSGSYDELVSEYGLAPADIADAVRRAVAAK